MFVKRLNRDTYDVFTGNGWSTWSRVKKENGALKLVAGAYLNKSSFTQLKERLYRK